MEESLIIVIRRPQKHNPRIYTHPHKKLANPIPYDNITPNSLRLISLWRGATNSTVLQNNA